MYVYIPYNSKSKCKTCISQVLTIRIENSSLSQQTYKPEPVLVVQTIVVITPHSKTIKIGACC